MKVISYPSAPLEAANWQMVDKSKVMSGSPSFAWEILHENTGAFSSGIYECTPGKWRVSYAEDEFCTLIEGHVRLIDDAGNQQDFIAPASFMIPSGFSGAWEAVTKVRKYFVIYDKEAK